MIDEETAVVIFYSVSKNLFLLEFLVLAEGAIGANKRLVSRHIFDLCGNSAG
jgi:hypothetical protein